MKQFLAGLIVGALIGWALTATFTRSVPEAQGPSAPVKDVEAARIEPFSPPEP